MVFHVVSVLQIGLGAAVLALAVLLWSRFRRFSSGILAVTSILLYATVLLEILDLYDLFDMKGPLFRGQPLFRSIITLLLLAAMFITLFVFSKEEKK
jgi:hypothetical protein